MQNFENIIKGGFSVKMIFPYLHPVIYNKDIPVGFIAPRGHLEGFDRYLTRRLL